MTTPTLISFAKARKLLKHAKYARLYSNGDLFISSEEEFKGKKVDFTHIIRGFVRKVSVKTYEKSSEAYSEHVTAPVCALLREGAFGALALARPERVEFTLCHSSPASEKHGLDANTLRFKYEGGFATEFTYLSQARTQENYVMHGEVTLLRQGYGLTANLSLPGKDDQFDGEFTLDADIANAVPAVETQAAAVQ